MKSLAHCCVVMGCVLAFNGWAPGASAKTIVVDFHDAAVFVSPGNHFAAAAPSGPQGSARFLPVSARRIALHGAYGANAPLVRDDTYKAAPAQQGDFRAMLLLGALLVAHQLRRKHRSLKQSLIAG